MKKTTVSRLLTCACIFLLIVAPILVRLSTATYPNMTAEERAVYQDRNGSWYMTDPDSYYHVRIVDNHLATGSLGNTVREDGTPWDSLSFWPEGRTAEYSPGIVTWTEAVWKPLNALFGVQLYDVEFCLSAVMSVLPALAAYLLVRRMTGSRLGGLTAGLLVSCAPAFVVRTTFGRYDTDMFVLLMDILLILFLTEALRAGTWKRCLCFSGAFVLTAVAYSFCWTRVAVILIAGFTLFGGLIASLWNAFDSKKKGGQRALGTIAGNRGILSVLGCGAAVLLSFMLMYGTGILSEVFSYVSLTSSYTTTSGVLPNEYMLISELAVPSFFPTGFGQWFLNLSSKGGISVMTGVGGVFPILLCLTAFILLAFRCFGRRKDAETSFPAVRDCRIYGCVLLVVLASWLFLLRYGFRFVEHLAVPVCLAAGACIGWAAVTVKKAAGRKRTVCAGIIAVVCFFTLGSAAMSAAGNIRGFVPSVSRASEEAMDWIRENAEDPEAVIASWWDNGYYYEYASGHPCLWDGGSMNPVRVILVSKAMITDDPELSRRILLMLSSTGDQAAEYLLERTDATTAFDSLWGALTMGKEEARAFLTERCRLSDSEAEEAERLIHPEKLKETYLLLTDSMMMQYGWFEYYAFWDFTGDSPLPKNTTYDHTPDGYPMDRPEARDYMELIRTQETLWRIYLQAEETEQMTCVFRGDDGLEHVRIWRIEPPEA